MHEIDFTNNENGNVFAVKESMWHKYGEIKSVAPTFEEALIAGGHDYVVAKQNCFNYVLTDNGYQYVPSELAYVTVRTDSGAELGSVGPDYHVVQNRDAFKVLTPLIDNGVATIETGGTLRNGADAWLLVKWDLTKFDPIVMEVFKDEITAFSLVANNHSGRRGILISMTNIRVVCANTLGMAERSGIGQKIMIKHTEGANVRLVEEAEAMFTGLTVRYKAVAEQYRLLKQTILTDAVFKKLVIDVMTPDPLENKLFNPEAKRAESVIAKSVRRSDSLKYMWKNGMGHVGDCSAWEAYNAATQELDHNTELYPTRAGVWRNGALLDGPLATKKSAVLQNLVNYAYNA